MKFLLTNKNFLLLILGRTISNIGDSIYYVAAMWLVYELGKSTFYTGLAGFLIMLPKIFQFLVGPFVDRWQMKNTLILTQILQCLFLLILPLAYYMDFLTVGLILIVMPILAFIEQFSYPAQNKTLPLLLEKKDLLKANTYFSFAYQGIDLIFNSLSGIFVALIGAITIFIADSITFAICALLFKLIIIPHKKNENISLPGKKAQIVYRLYFKELREGFTVVFQGLMPILIGAVAINFAIGITYAILPSFAAARGGSQIYGYYLTGLSAGSLIGALLASQLGRLKVSNVSIVGFALSACCWISSAFVSHTLLGIVLFGIAWIPIGCINIILGTVNQLIIPNSMLGRVTSVSYSISAISLPLGSLIGGYLATVINSETIFAITGGGSLFIALVWLLHPKLRRLPQAKEINSETFNLRFEKTHFKEPS